MIYWLKIADVTYNNCVLTSLVDNLTGISPTANTWILTLAVLSPGDQFRRFNTTPRPRDRQMDEQMEFLYQYRALCIIPCATRGKKLDIIVDLSP